MKTALASLLLVAALFSGGCMSAANRMQKFLSEIPATNLAEFKHATNSPVFQTEQKATNIVTREDGRINVGGASSKIVLPLVGVSDEVTLTGFVQIPTPEQVKSGAAIVNARPATPR